MRYLSIDLGEKRTGLAIGDDRTRIASPLTVIETRNKTHRLARIEETAQEYHPDAVVVGLPLNMDGTEGPAARKTRAFADEVAKRLRLPTHLVDERLSTYAADEQLSQTGLTHKAKKSRRDALAAAQILRTFWEEGETGGSRGRGLRGPLNQPG